MRRPVFERGRGLRVEDDRYRSLHLGPDRGAAIGEYAARESSEYSDSYYAPADNYEGRDFAHPDDQRGPEEWARPHSFYGRGPSGYRRSDERLLEAVCERLTDDAQVDASDISVEVRDAVVSLTGTVADKHAKWHVEDLVESISGVNGVDNRLRCPRGA